MAFANTLTLTIAGTAHVLNRVNQDNYGSEYQYSGATSAIVMKIRHSTDSVDSDGIQMKRHNVYIERIIYPTPTTLLQKQSWTVTIRGGSLESASLAADLAKAADTWLVSGTVVDDLSVGVN